MKGVENMIKNELKLYMKSKMNFIMLIFMSIPIILSYYLTNLEKAEWTEQLHSTAKDLNLEKVQSIVDGYSGFTYIYNFVFSPDFYIIFFLITLMGFSCMFGGRIFSDLKSGFGNMIIVRKNYSKYLSSLLISQTIYISFFIIIFFVLLTVITNIIFPFKFNTNLTSNIPNLDPSIYNCFKFYFFQIILTNFIIVLIMNITSLSNFLFKNKYIIHCVPLIVYFIPYILASTIGNLSTSLGSFLSTIVCDHHLLSIYYYKISNANLFQSLISFILLPSILLFIVIASYILNKKRFQEMYK